MPHVSWNSWSHPWSNSVDKEIEELKKGVSCKFLQSRAPKCILDNCLELEAYINPSTAHDIYKLDGGYPKQ